MARHKVIIGEWLRVYSRQTMIIDTDKDIEKMGVAEIVDLIENDNGTTIEITREDVDWTTEEHHDWNTQDNDEFTYVEKMGE